MSALWPKKPIRYSPEAEIHSSSAMRKKATVSSMHRLIREDSETLQWDSRAAAAASDAEQDDTSSSVVSTESTAEVLSPTAILTITKLKCQLESKQERITYLEKQIEDLQQDRSFLRSQIENLTRGPKTTEDTKPRKRSRTTSSSSACSTDSSSDMSLTTVSSATSSEVKKRKHHKDKRRGKKSKDYSRKRATGVQYVIHRYKQVLSTFNKKKSMSGAFRHYGIDRNTIANTAPIAELHLAAKDMLSVVGLFNSREETLVKYAQKCATLMENDESLSRKIELMKATGELLPITAKKSKIHDVKAEKH
ncbi:coiled-coil domain-containing protein 106-like isoform X1 [Acipenser oxyrinchus oxyrinchus]|uniref:Coiled-coil domain-containing protein 106-like isoform X1 n=1 Tax=Acipenser oxyrinchus oxyrinchus TaxID=40147 RepID=A0AAD8GGK2_ACIOX|nr:coiled-coil domain-containing protein 106-like isoform X1 [Acipenser oxyrinchus oxyrinchus]